MAIATVFLIPSPLDEDSLQSIPAYVLEAVETCQSFYTEEERTARRFFKKLKKEIIIDNYRWYNMRKEDPEMLAAFREDLRLGHTVGIVSEAGCPGIADPGQALVAIAQESGATVKPLVGPSSILLALMASGMNGQQFRFCGYLPIDQQQRVKGIQKIEADSETENCTQVFIETPYRNNQMLESLLKHCKPSTRICVAADLTSKEEWVRTMTVNDWKNNIRDLHKRPVIFLLLA